MTAARRLRVRVTTRASSNRIVSRNAEPWRVAVTAVPEKGKANRAVVDLLARELGVARSRVRIVRGETAREKTVEVDGGKS